jgi:ring-1,2-phenylacetyl-CoA epoxidase subunit PaaD
VTTVNTDPVDTARIRDAVADVLDPEIPVLTIDDLGILRAVRIAADGVAEVVITPTYSGCPATEAIQRDVAAVAHQVDPSVRVVIELSPAWTTDWITDSGRGKLSEYGIAPPSPSRQSGPVLPSCTARSAAPATPRFSASSAPRPARRCAAAGPAANRSTSSNRYDRPL